MPLPSAAQTPGTQSPAAGVTGAQPTLENTSRSILAGLGNDSPTGPQLAAVEAWIAKEGSFGSGGPYSNNPLNVTGTNVQASIAAGYLPHGFQYSIPDPAQNGGNPVVQFPDLTSGIMAGIAGIKQQFATPIRNLLSSPSSTASLQDISNAIAASGWGTGSITGVSPNPGQTGGSGGDIGVTSGGTTAGGNQQNDPCSAKSGIDALTCKLDQLTLAISKDIPRALAYVVGAILILLGVVIIVVDDLKVSTPVGTISAKDVASKVAA